MGSPPGGSPPRASKWTASASGHPGLSFQSPYKASISFLGVPGKGLLLLTDSNWLMLLSLNQPPGRGFEACSVRRSHLHDTDPELERGGAAKS